MHMLEALLALYEASNDPQYLRRADGVIALLQERFIDPKSGLLFEFFDEKLVPIKPAIIEPGHMAEWCWLLHRRSMLAEKADFPLMKQLGVHADGYASMGDGYLLDAFNQDGTVAMPTRRLWGQTEWLKSIFARMDTPTSVMQPKATALLERINKSYLNTKIRGLWIDQFDLEGQKMSKYVPASIVYHLVSAAAEIEGVKTTNADVVK